MQNEETQWKKERFRKETQNSTENFESNINPDVAYIKQKIKKINRRKKYKEMFNVSEPLTNIYETPASSIFTPSEPTDTSDFGKTSPMEKIIREANLQQETLNVEKKNEKPFSKLFNIADLFKCRACDDAEDQEEIDPSKLAEGFDVDSSVKGELNKQKSSAGMNVDFSEYTEPVKKGFNKINDAFFFIPKKLNEVIEKFFLNFVKMFYIMDKKNPKENEKNMENDAEILKIICYMIAMYPIAIYICYNWTFLTVFKSMEYKDDPDSEEPGRPASDKKRTKISFNGLPSTVRMLLNFIFDFGIMPTNIFDMGILSDKSWALPNMLSFIGSKILMKAILLIFSITVVYMFDVYNVFENLMLGGAVLSNVYMVTGYCMTVIMIYFAYWVIQDIKQIATPDISSDADAIYADLRMRAWTGFPYIMIFLTIIYYIVRFALTFFNIGISAVVLTIFIWIHSLFGMAIYGNNGFSFDGIKQTMRDIDVFIDKDFEVLMPLDPKIKEYTIFEKMFIDIVRFFKNNMYAFFFLIMIVGSLFSITKYIKSPSLKLITSTFFSLLGVGMMVYKFVEALGKTKPPAENPSVNKYNVGDYLNVIGNTI
jgi:hypothetical protein